MLFVAASFTVSSQAYAYLLDPYNVVWQFDGRGSASPGGPETEFLGSLRFNAPTVYVSAIPATSTTSADVTFGFIGNSVFQNSAAGAGSDGVSSGPPLTNDGSVIEAGTILHPTSVTWGEGKIGLDLVDVDGVAFDAGFSNPAGGFLPPETPPDISLFESRAITFYQSFCSDAETSCAQGGGVRQFLPIYSITIDRFVEGVPEPGALGLGALACLGLAALRLTLRAD